MELKTFHSILVKFVDFFKPVVMNSGPMSPTLVLHWH